MSGESMARRNTLLLRVVSRHLSSVSDNPRKWELYQESWPREKSKVRRTKRFKDFTLHWMPGRDLLKSGSDILVTNADDYVVGNLYYGIENEGDEVMKGAVEVHPAWRRKGIATALYSWAEELEGKTFIPEETHTQDAEAFWKQKNRPFGRR